MLQFDFPSKDNLLSSRLHRPLRQKLSSVVKFQYRYKYKVPCWLCSAWPAAAKFMKPLKTFLLLIEPELD